MRRRQRRSRNILLELNDVEKTKIYTEILSEPTDEEIEQMILYVYE